QQMRNRQIRYEKQVVLLENEVARLTREIDELTNIPAELEKLAREKLGLAGKNEKIFIIEPTPSPELSTNY
ncbi:MAG: septum formation initiator family protein, partial [Candidatus Auribacterota bacterium]|nr:septum formation initiator family protein [Candidatus Auribacterota bacterium]